MSRSLQQLRERLKAAKSKEGKNNGERNRNVFPFWNMDNDQEAVVRILRDKNEDNPDVFFVDKLEHKIAINGKTETIPCLKMYNQACPICELSQQYYKAGDKEKGKYYYRSKSSIVRILVIKDPLPADPETGETYVGKSVNTQFGYQIMELINSQLLAEGDDGLEADPWDLDNGYNFIIKKSKQGEYSTYALGSTFARKASALPAELKANVELVDLSTLLPKNPGIDKVQAKLNLHLTGSEGSETEDETTDENDHGNTVATSRSAPKPESVRTPVQAKTEEEEVEAEEDDSDVENLLLKVRNRLKS